MATSKIAMSPGMRDVLEAANSKAAELGLTLSEDAIRTIEERASPAVGAIEIEDKLPQHREEIQQNTHAFIEYVFQTQLNATPGIITIDHISNALSSYCQKHKNQLPFCR
jgi:hypothetical protein